MAYAVLVSLAQTIDNILNDVFLPISVNGKQLIESIQNEIAIMREFLEKFPKEASSSVERRIGNAANEAQDILEHFATEQMLSQIKLRRAAEAGIARPNFKHLYDLQELRWVIKEMNSIAEEVTAIKIMAGRRSASPPVSRSLSRVISSTGENIMVGFDEDSKKVKEMLCAASPKLQVIPIVGMGGIGKTTLARSIYESETITYRFDTRAWVTVSQDFDCEKVFSKLLSSIKNEEKSGTSLDSMEERIKKCLTGRRYLIVLDDVWSNDAWDNLKRVFPDDNSGSRIMLTTRLLDLASYAATSSFVCKMRFLSEEESWELLGQKVFKHENLHLQLEKLGKEIANEVEKIMRSCGGLPLAIVLIAGLLSSISKTQSSWKGIIDSLSYSVATKDARFEVTFQIIQLSYTYLPQHLRLCFLYMGCFPEDYEIHASKLIKLWIAEGYVRPTLGKSLEENAEQCLEDLVKRSLVLVTSRKTNGKIKTCSLHDMVRELSKRKSLEENCMRRLSIAHPDLKGMSRTYGSTIRSIITFQPSDRSLASLRKFRLLRVLDVVDVTAYSLPAQVFELFHLRYLGIGCPMKIPAAISMLQNLQTLVIWPRKGSRQYSNDEVYLPMEIWKLLMLRHVVSFYDILPDPEEAPFALTSLRTLSVVKKFVCTKRMLERIPNLKKLEITYFGRKCSEAHQLNNLVHLHHLETLELTRNGDSPVHLDACPEFPPSLKKLTLSGWHFRWEYMTSVGSLPNLEVLKLRDNACNGQEWETSEGEFPSLTYLLIDRSDLRSWKTESSHFARLKSLVLYCVSLSEIPDAFGEVPTLQLIEVDMANNSLLDSAKKIQEEQKNWGNDDLQVRSVRYHYQVRFNCYLP